MASSIVHVDSVQFVNVPVTAPAGVTINSQPVSIAVVPRGTYPSAGYFRTAEWEGTTARVLIGPGNLVLVPGVHEVFVKVTDSPEVPIVPAGTITARR